MIALFRPVSDTFASALSRATRDRPLDVGCARAEQRAVADAMAAAGAEISWLPAHDFPDGCFVEDTGVFLPGALVLTRPGAPSRRGEVAGVAEWAADRWPTVRLTAPATLDGGDVLRIGDHLYIGRSERTNAEGVAQLSAIARRSGLTVTALPTDDLHLKCACSPLDDHTLLVSETLPRSWFPDVDVIPVPADEAWAANAVTVGRTAILAAGHPITRARVADAGFAVVEVAVRELRRADGSLTCLSLRAVPGCP